MLIWISHEERRADQEREAREHAQLAAETADFSRSIAEHYSRLQELYAAGKPADLSAAVVLLDKFHTYGFGHYEDLGSLEPPIRTLHALSRLEGTNSNENRLKLYEELVRWNPTNTEYQQQVNDLNAVVRAERNKKAREARLAERRREREEGQAADRPSKTDAWIMAEVFVKDNLQAPGSASFGSIFGEYQNPEECVSDLGSNRFCVDGWVDAENLYGGKPRSNFRCILKYLGNDRWSLESINISLR